MFVYVHAMADRLVYNLELFFDYSVYIVSLCSFLVSAVMEIFVVC